ncbi:sugar ABC transporter substrate-binding protein [Paenibacillus baekrokdamisoli]|uniref:Sugar ABC transporter substrate-binding protein n=1 Tax=Paenibacillus baekrokdamisoli TaxID=1712516 RepID=A0A3G9IPN9_9BACL|nr:extracellular solute-binding protein [Paenibacillus baekrokdamisoli]MBB3072024.1 ABC-type glycerol-3-phosphate transport system substrate-binding protein [Paenibacillus baekrokdamisoli]BBH20326.1 sugar ABC transporter substrate-binding protein [Paenibacillus baekrokdamisoli]
MAINKSINKVMVSALIAVSLFTISACSSNNTSKKDPVNTGDTTKPTNETDKTNEGKTNTPPAEDHKPVEITISTWVPADSPEWHKISDAFTKKYPWITVKWLFNNGGADTLKAVTQSIASGSPIDVFWNNTFNDVVTQGFAENLDPYIAKDTDFTSYEFNKGILEPFQFKGSQYALSRGNDTFIFFYNKDILAKYGIDTPKNDWTWEDLKAAAQKATHPEDKVWGMANNTIFVSFAAADLAAANGHSEHIMDLNGDLSTNITYVGADKDVMDDNQWLNDWVTKDGIMLNDKRQKDAGIDGDMFASGHAAFYYHVSPTIPGFKAQWKFNWDIAPTPAGTAKQVGTSFNNPMFLSKAGKHKEEAFLFMKFWAASVEGQKILMSIGGTLPNSSNAEITDAFKALDTYKGINVDALIYAAKIGETDPTIYIPGGADVGSAIGGWVASGYQEEKSAYDYFPTIADKTNKAIADALAKTNN